MLDVASLFAAFAYGLAGSLHCVAMCGPLTIVASSSPRRRASLPIVANESDTVHGAGQQRFAAAIAYQIARLAGYAAIGAIFGALGHQLDLSLGVTVSKLLPYLLVTLLVVQALDVRLALDRLVPRIAVAKLARFRPRNGVPLAAFMGGITALIPCGFLYSTVPLAVATGSAIGGAAMLVAFAMGTAPALMATSALGSLPWMKRPIAQAARRFALAAAAIIIVLRLVLLQPTHGAAEMAAQTMNCHGGQTDHP